MNFVLKCIALWSISLFFAYCNPRDLNMGMVSFDKAFIPAWYYLNIGDQPNAQNAMLVLNGKWNKLENQFYQSPSAEQADWKATVEQIDSWLSQATEAIADKDLERAIYQLDHARYELIDLRWREKMTYYLDNVWDLEASIYQAQSVAADPMLDLLEWNEFACINEQVFQSWARLESLNPDEEHFGFSPQESILYQKYKRDLGLVIHRYLEETECVDICRFAEEVGRLEPAYWNFLRLFGDFESTQTYLVNK